MNLGNAERSKRGWRLANRWLESSVGRLCGLSAGTAAYLYGDHKLGLLVRIFYNGRAFDQGKKIGWRDGIRAIYAILKYNLFRGSMS